MNQPAEQKADYSLAREVGILITQARAGDPMDLELTGHAQDVLDDMQAQLAGMPELAADLERRIGQFARKTGTVNMYLHLVVTNEKPDLQHYDPSQVSVYDGISDGGIDFSSADVRSTIYGTVMTSVNVTDLAAYFRSGQKFVLVAHLGTDRDQDLNALEAMLSTLPALLEATGMRPEQIADIVNALKKGDFPPAALKALHIAAEIGRLKTGMRGPMTPEIAARIKILGRDFAKLTANPGTLRGLPSVLAQALTALRPLVRAIAVAPARPLGMAITARNDNHAPQKSVASPAVQKLVQDIRALARDRKSLTPMQRRELASVLRDLRQGIRPVFAAQARRLSFQSLQTGLIRAQRFVAVNLRTASMVPVMAVMLPSVVMSTASASSSPRVVSDYKATVAPMLVQPETLAPPIQTAIQQPVVQQAMATIDAAPQVPVPAPVPQQAPDTPQPAEKPGIPQPQENRQLDLKHEIKTEPQPGPKTQPAPELRPELRNESIPARDDRAPETSMPPVISAVVAPSANDAKKADPAAETVIKGDGKNLSVPAQELKYKADGTPDDCCRGKFKKVVEPVDVKTRQDVSNVLGQDVARRVTVSEGRGYVASDHRAAITMEKSGIAVVDTGDKAFQRETEKLIKQLGGHGPDCQCGKHFKGVAGDKPNTVKEAEAKLKTLSLADKPKISARSLNPEF